MTDKSQVPWNLWQGHFCSPSPVTARLALGHPHPHRDAHIWEARKVEPFGFEPAWSQPHGQGCSRQCQAGGREQELSIRPARREGGIPLETFYVFLTPGEEGCHGRRGNPLSKKPPVPGARLCGRLCCQGVGLGGSPVGRACGASGELCCHFPVGLSWSALPSVSPSTHPGWRDVGGLFLISSSFPLLPSPTLPCCPPGASGA